MTSIANGTEARDVVFHTLDWRNQSSPLKQPGVELSASTDVSFKDIALRYAAVLGWRVFRIAPWAKVPFKGSHGLLDATTDAHTVADWWDDEPAANVAVATGKLSGILVIDVDARNGGSESFQRLVEERGALPETPQQRTPSGGAHYLLGIPEHVGLGALRNSASSVLGPGIDVRADGGYILVAPSRTKHGEYTWEISPFDLPPAPIPPKWLERLLSKPQTSQADLKSLTIPDGSRNSTLFRHAARLRAEGYTEEEIEQILITLNDSRCQPPLEPDELAKIAASAARYDVERAIEPRPQSEEMRLLELEDKARQNPLLRSAGRTIVEFLKYVDRGYQKGWADQDGRVVVHYPHVAKELAISSDSVGRHVKAGYDVGLLDKVTVRLLRDVVDKTTGEVRTRPTRRASFKLEGSLEDALQRVADFQTPDGKPLKLSRDSNCRLHPDTRVTRATKSHCPECERLVNGVQ